MVYEKGKKGSFWQKIFGRGPAEDEHSDEKEDPDTRTKVDAALLHDIVPQPGGDYEPLNETKTTSMEGASTFFLKVITLGFYGH